jgi:hypothetical protein
MSMSPGRAQLHEEVLAVYESTKQRLKAEKSKPEAWDRVVLVVSSEGIR